MNIDVYISNLSEDVWDFIESLKEKDKKFEIEENSYLSDRELLTISPDIRTIIILPVPVDPAFISYYKKLFSNKNIKVLVPEKHSGQTCVDIQADTKLWNHLIRLGKKHHLILKSYSASTQFYSLVRNLKQSGCTVTVSECPSEGAEWTVNYFGSKSGIRKTAAVLSSNIEKKWIAKGEVVETVEQAVYIATSYYINGGVVLKTNKAHSGAGVVIIPPNSISGSASSFQEYFDKLFKKEQYWSKFPIIIEEFLQINASVGGGNPNCEYKIDDLGKPHLLYLCGMRITESGVFKGVEVSNSIFSESIKSQLKTYGEALADTYVAKGYRGYFDVDCMYTQSNELLITESNVRKTGGTHVYHTGRILLGDDFCNNYYLLSNNAHQISLTKEYTFSEVYKILKPLLFTKKKGSGIILAAANILKQHRLSHIIVGKDKESTLALEAEMESLLT